MKSLSWSWAMTALVLGGLTPSCEQRSARALPIPPAVSSLPAQEISNQPTLFTRRALLDGMTKLGEAVGQPPRALELTIHRDHLVLQAQNPQTPTEVLQYVYRNGDVSPGVRVELRGKGELEENLFPLGDVSLDRIPDLCEEARRRVDPVGGRVNHVLVRRNLPESADIELRVYVMSPTKDGYLDADQRGNVIEPSTERVERD